MNFDYVLQSEDASEHWKFFDVKDHVVLDLGCGRWYTEKFEEFGPIYFRNQGAKLVVGIDSSKDEIDYFQESVNGDPHYIFECMEIKTSHDILNLLQRYPTISALKCDIEGHERVLLELHSDDLQNITELAIEYHSKELNTAFVDKVKEWGFDIKLNASMTTNEDRIGVLFCSRKLS